MTLTVDNCVAKIREHFPDCDPAVAIAFLNEVNAELCMRHRLRADTTEDITLTSGTQTYALDDDIMRIWDARYFTNATTSTSLVPTSIDELDYNSKSWRSESAGTPTHYFEQGGQLGLYPTPNTTTALGFPVVKLYVARSDTLASGGNMPSAVLNHSAWIYGVCAKFAAAKNNEKTGVYFQLFRDAEKRLGEYAQGKVVRQKPSLQMQIPRINSV